MAEVIRMPKMSDTMEEGVIVEWHKKVGDQIKVGDVLAEVETDKATMDLESYNDGTLLYIGVEKGQAATVNGVIAVVGEKGEDYKSLLEDNGNEKANVDGKNDGPSKTNDISPTEKRPNDAQSKEISVSEKDATSATEKVEDINDNESDTEEAKITGEKKPTSESKNTEKRAEESQPSATAKVETTATKNVKANVIRMPKMSDTMEEGTLVSWQKKVGDKVKTGDILAEVETDKATMDLESYDDGTLLYIGIKEGESVPIDAVIAVIGEEGADYKALLSGDVPDTGKTDEKAEQAPKETEVEDMSETATEPIPKETLGRNQEIESKSEGQSDTDERVRASPLAKKLASEKGIDIRSLAGSGENGRIVMRDVNTAKSAPPSSKEVQKLAEPSAVEMPKTAATPQEAGNYSDVPLSQMRKTIARRLSESMYNAPHFYVTIEINMDKAMELRPTINEASPVKISFNDMVLKACALALKQHPSVNSSWLGDKIRTYKEVHIGVAVAVDEGLLVPVVRNADIRSLSSIAADVKDLAGKAKEKKLQPKDWEGSTFSISNLGMFGIDEFTAIINSPNSCILAIGVIKQVAAFREDGTVYPANIMKVTLSCDHRVVDGAIGAAFLQTLKKLLENPMRMLI